MATPILNLVRPGRGWAVGGGLVQLDGNDFRTPTPPAGMASAPVPAPPPTVQVLFGGVPAPHVEVISSAILRVIMPPHAPDRRKPGGTVISTGLVDVTVRNLDDDGNPIPGEEATLAKAFTFTRPELGTKTVRGGWLRVVDGFIDHWRNICMENVMWNPATDYDAELGDVRGYVKMASLPGIAVTNVAFPDSIFEPEGGPAEVDVDAATLFLRQVPVASDMTFKLVLVSDHEGELVNLAEVVKACFRFGAFFPVALDPADPSAGVAQFVQILTGPISISERIGNTNLTTAEAPGMVARVMTLDVPGVPADPLPGFSKSYPAQGTRDVIRRLAQLRLGIGSNG